MALNDTTFDIATIAAVDGQETVWNKAQIKFCSPLSVQDPRCAIWHRQLWLKRKTFRCPCAHHARLPQQKILAAIFQPITWHQIVNSSHTTGVAPWSQIFLKVKLHTFVTLADKTNFEMSEIVKKTHSEYYFNGRVSIIRVFTRRRIMITGVDMAVWATPRLQRDCPASEKSQVR